MQFRFDPNQEFQIKVIETVCELFVCRDAALTDELAANPSLRRKLKTIQSTDYADEKQDGE